MRSLQSIASLRFNKVAANLSARLLDMLTWSETVASWFWDAWITATQVIDNKNTGTPRPVQWAWCYNFDGVNDYVIANALTTVKDDTNHTVSFRVKVEDSGTARLFNNCISSSSRYWCTIMSSEMRVWYYNGSSYTQIYSCPFSYIERVHILITHTSSWTIKAYFNWIEQGTSTGNSPSINWIVWLAMSDDSSNWIQGRMCDFRVYDTVLSQQDITAVYNNTYAGQTIARYKCDETQWVYAYDSSWYDNTGPIKNATLSAFHVQDNTLPYSFLDTVWYIENAGLKLPLWVTRQHPNTTLAYKTNPWYLRTTSSDPSSYLTATTPFVVYCRVKINLEWANWSFSNVVCDLPYGYLYVRGTGQLIQIRTDTNVSASVSQIYMQSWQREWIEMMWYIDPVTTSTKLYVNDLAPDTDIRTINWTINFNVNDIYIWHKVGTNANVTVSDLRIYTATSTVPSDADYATVRAGNIPSGWTKVHHLELDWDLTDTGTQSETRTQVNTGEYVDVYKLNTGKSPLNLDLVQSNCATFDGVDDYIAIAELTGSETVVSYEWTATPSIVSWRINATAGTLYNIVLSNWSHYPLSEWVGTTIYDRSVNWYNWTATSITAGTFRWSTQDTYHYNIHNNIPNPSWNRHNGAETKLKAPETPELIQADSTDDYWFNTSGVAQAKWYSDIVADVNTNHITMADVSVTNQKKNIVTFDSQRSPSTDPTLAEVQTLLNQ